MKVKALQAALLGGALAIAGCEGGGGPTDGGPPANFSFLGTWQLHVDAATNCWAEFDTRISITQASLSAGAGGASQVMNTAGWWYTAAPGPDHPSTLGGTINPATGTYSLDLWQGADASKQGHFNGTVANENRLSGTFTDPNDVFRAAPGTHPCSSTAHAIRD